MKDLRQEAKERTLEDLYEERARLENRRLQLSYNVLDWQSEDRKRAEARLEEVEMMIIYKLQELARKYEVEKRTQSQAEYCKDCAHYGFCNVILADYELCEDKTII